MKRARSLTAAVRRLHAMIAVLDEDLHAFDLPLSFPERLRDLAGEEGAEARAAIRMVEHSLDEMERDQVDANEEARDAEDYESEVRAMRELLNRCAAANFDWSTR